MGKIYICQLSRVHIAGEAIQRIPRVLYPVLETLFFSGRGKYVGKTPGDGYCTTWYALEVVTLTISCVGIFNRPTFLVHVYGFHVGKFYNRPMDALMGNDCATNLFGPSGHESVGRD